MLAVLAGAGPLECLEGHAAAGEGGVAVQNDPWDGQGQEFPTEPP